METFWMLNCSPGGVRLETSRPDPKVCWLMLMWCQYCVGMGDVPRIWTQGAMAGVVVRGEW